MKLSDLPRRVIRQLDGLPPLVVKPKRVKLTTEERQRRKREVIKRWRAANADRVRQSHREHNRRRRANTEALGTSAAAREESNV